MVRDCQTSRTFVPINSSFTLLLMEQLMASVVSDNGRIMYSSGAEILLCDLKLKPQESRSCAWRVISVM